MTYRLRIDPTIHDIYQALPDDARRDLSMCLVDALADPVGRSAPYGWDDGIWRTVARGYVTGAVMIDDRDHAIALVHITYAG